MERVDQRKWGIADCCVARKHFRTTKLDEIDHFMDWKPFEKILKKLVVRNANAVGNPAYPALIMFKCLLLQRLYNLSDEALEESLIDRISFLRFVGLGMEDDIPDATTICRFRNSLLEKKVGEKLFKEFIAQLQRQGLSISKGIAVDASVIQSARHPRKVFENIPEDRDEPDLHTSSTEMQEIKTVKVFSDDAEAAWIVKAGLASYGYKLNMASDVETGIILGGHMTPANHSDMNELPKILEEIPIPKGTRCFADKGYTSAANRTAVEEAGMKDGIMNKAVRGRKLTYWEQLRNRLISSFRSGIERIFGNLKRNFRFQRSRYVGRMKVEQEFFFVAFAANLIRATKLAAR